MTTRRALVAIGFLGALASGADISYVASIRPNNSAEARTFTEYFPGGRFSATAVTVRGLLRIAYRIQDYQLVGAPAWFATQRYDFAAKIEDDPVPSQQIFLRALLADRFKLVVHNEARELPTFALVLAKSDGRLGPQLIKSEFDCAAYLAAPHALPDPGRTPPCGARSYVGTLSAKSIAITQLATTLTAFLNRLTIDKTGLTGRFDVELTWSPEQLSYDAARDDVRGPSIFTALQEQLGLRLVPGKGAVDVLIVDRAEIPSEN
jgi:uncharacterized protein (TIGR03435 family)